MVSLSSTLALWAIAISHRPIVELALTIVLPDRDSGQEPRNASGNEGKGQGGEEA